MITKIVPVQELKQIFLEVLLNKTDKVNDVSAESVLNGIAFGCAKVGQKCLVNQSVVEGHLFPDTAYGSYLDELAAIRGIAPRFGAAPSTTYVRFIGEEGTFYNSAELILYASTGVTFTLEEDVVIGANGYAYGKVRATSNGANTNVDPLSINRMNVVPQGHLSVTNEYRASGGRDYEDDELFRQRIKDSVNQLSRNTMSYMEQVFMKINDRVLRLHKGGVTADGKMNLIVVSVNGQDFTQEEFNEILSRSEEFLPLDELLRENTDFALNLQNVDWLPVDVEFRVDIDPAYDQAIVRRNIAIQMNKLFDYRFWKYGDKVEWENLLYAAKNVEGVRYVPDTHFYPSTDINVPRYRLPRIRGFILRDLNGDIIEDNGGLMSDVYYPNTIAEGYAASVLSNI
ncbi:MAG: baseplate J/gp47 family protein [Paludibacteraceae bacterium]|nr:baseplate J/gp47 family protein [Paludibacteraceae bacterium]